MNVLLQQRPAFATGVVLRVAGVVAMTALVAACGTNRAVDAPAEPANQTLEGVEIVAEGSATAELEEQGAALTEEAGEELAEVVEEVAGEFVPDPAIVGRPCTDSDACGEGYQCDFTQIQGCSDEPGVCRVTPVPICTREFNPICGCDGRTYGNPCDIAVHGVATAHHGPCGDERLPGADQ